MHEHKLLHCALFIQSPAEAARALRRFVKGNNFNETVVVHLLSEIVRRAEGIDDVIGFSDVSRALSTACMHCMWRVTDSECVFNCFSGCS